LRAAEALRTTLAELIFRITESAQADQSTVQQHQQIVIAELNHRVRNILGLVRGLISQSAATAADIRSLVAGLDNRIRSLARAQELLTQSDWEPTSLHSLISPEIDTYGGLEFRLILIGPDVILQPRAFIPMALVAHELATNSQKYGALSAASGQITLTTSADAQGNINISWREAGGPPVSKPTRRGFGSTLLEQVIPFELNGTCSPKFAPEGYSIDIVLPAAVAQISPKHLSSNQENAFDRSPTNSDQLPKLLKKCLIVEDNLFIAIDAEDLLRSIGAGSVHVAKSLEEAINAVEEQEFSFALLDLNLGDVNSLPVARLLRARAIPFAFGTGYGDCLSTNEVFSDVPVISKPYNRAAMIDSLSEFTSSLFETAAGLPECREN
jgi:two-component sensor histidine kinase/CheY-like chemotaxis protein